MFHNDTLNFSRIAPTVANQVTQINSLAKYFVNMDFYALCQLLICKIPVPNKAVGEPQIEFVNEKAKVWE